MNAERLHVIAAALKQEMAELETVQKLQNLCNSLQQVASQGNHPQFQTQLAANLKEVYAAFGNNPSDEFSPAWRQALAELGGTNLFGNALKSTIEEIFKRNQLTPSVALTELQQLQQQLASFGQALDQLLSSFKKLKIGNEKLEPGQCEIGMLIPRDAVGNTLSGFAQELKELILVLNTFSEVATGKPEDLSIKTISSSDLTVYLHATPPFAACLAVAIERIVALYKQLVEIRKIKAELLKQGVPEKQTAGIEDHANNLMSTGIDALAVEITEKYHPGKDGHRKNELTNAVRISLNRIANRIDRGYNIEVRVEPLKGPAQASEEGKNIAEQVKIIQAASANMQFLKLEGAPILQLSEGDKPKSEGERSKSKRE